MRSDRTATWTSGDPVSPDFSAYSPISACLRSAVIDIGAFPSTIDHSHRPETPVFDPRQPNQKLVVPRTDDRAVVQPVEAGAFTKAGQRNLLTVAKSGGLVCGQSQGRDVVQRSFDRQYMPGSEQTMPKGGRQIQRNCQGFAKPADGEAAQCDDVTNRAERLGQVARQRANIGTLADRSLEIGVVWVGKGGQFQLEDVDRALDESRRLAGASKGIGTTAGDLDRRIGGRTLEDRARKKGQG